MSSAFARVFRHGASFGAYPITMIGCFLLFYLTRDSLTSVWAAYLAVIVGGLAITLHEWLLPAKNHWHPQVSDIANDTTYMVVGQIGFERLLTLGALFGALALASNLPWQLDSLWIHNAPLWFQAIVVLVVGDFFRYWLHRAFHKFTWMWSFHAVHHSPNKLYWLNVGRFHPIEQATQFFVDALPFILIGVTEDVLSIYFVFYAVNGFYQHSNCRVRLGFLNWIVAGPELHRWHHSELLAEANHNYGNNLILWDVIFGTRFLPIDRDVEQLGIPVKNYPMSFGRQMLAPFEPWVYRD